MVEWNTRKKEGKRRGTDKGEEERWMLKKKEEHVRRNGGRRKWAKYEYIMTYEGDGTMKEKEEMKMKGRKNDGIG